MKKFDLTKVTTAVTNKAGVLGKKVQIHSPEILLVIGIGTMVGAVVTAVVASKKQEEVTEDHLDRLKAAKETEVEVTVKKDDGEEVTETIVRSEKEVKSEVFKVYRTTAGKEVKTWGPTATLMGVSIACFVGMHNIQASRIAGVTLAYNGVSEAFKHYQENNIALNGEENHQMCKNGFKTVKEVDDDGFTTEKVVPKDATDIANERKSRPLSDVFYDHTYIFDLEHAPTTYVKNTSSMFNLNFLDSCERAVQNIVDARGYCSADEAARMLGLERDPDQVIIDLQDGWVRGGENVSFNHKQPLNNPSLAGFGNKEIILEFNVHGNLTYMLDQKARLERKMMKDLADKKNAETVEVA